MNTTTTHRPISAVANDIMKDMLDQCQQAKKPTNMNQKYAPALAYLRPMRYLTTVKDAYGMDDAKSIIAYGLSNMQSYKGEKAKQYKAELKAIAGIK